MTLADFDSWMEALMFLRFEDGWFLAALEPDQREFDLGGEA